MTKLKNALLTCLLPAAAVILELLPSGAVLHMAAGPHDSIKYAYPYFSLTPFGYANFGPLIAAVLTAPLLILGIIYAARYKSGLLKAQRWVSLAALLASLMPAAMLGAEYLTGVGAAITALLFAQTLVCFVFSARKNR